MIKIFVDQIGKEEQARFHFDGTQSNLGLLDLEFPIYETHIDFQLFEADSGYYLAGQLTGTARLQCHRCLEEFDYPLNLELSALITFEQRKEFEGEGGVIFIPPQSREIDITKYVHDSILLDIPFKVLCKEDCSGLCPQCGTNRNYNTCNCEQDAVDPRWEKLKELNFDEK